jgi:hypothetical protein
VHIFRREAHGFAGVGNAVKARLHEPVFSNYKIVTHGAFRKMLAHFQLSFRIFGQKRFILFQQTL